MKEESEEICLLKQAVDEIQRLRTSNEKMKLRLQMFDDMKALINCGPVDKSQGMAEYPDIVYKIVKFINTPKTSPTLPE